jgi:hypothetical protein
MSYICTRPLEGVRCAVLAGRPKTPRGGHGGESGRDNLYDGVWVDFPLV